MTPEDLKLTNGKSKESKDKLKTFVKSLNTDYILWGRGEAPFSTDSTVVPRNQDDDGEKDGSNDEEASEWTV